MSDFQEDEHDDSSFHITPSSSALTALPSLDLPLTPSQLAITWSLGDIPVVLFDDAYAIDDGTLTQPPNAGVSVRNGDSYVFSSAIPTPDFKRVPSQNSRVGPRDDFHASGSSNTVASVGTFGPRRINLKLCCNTPLSAESSFSSPTSRTVDYERRGTMLPHTLKGLFPGTGLPGNDKKDSFPSLRTVPDSTLEYRAYESPKIPQTSDRTASWLHSQNYGFPEIISPAHGASADGRQASSLFGTPTRRAILTDDMTLVDGEASSPPRIPLESQGCKSSHQIETFHLKHFRQPREDFAWIGDITVQCLIDQEGFRSVQPSFKLSGIVHLRSSLDPQTPGPATAHFRPITRQSFHFHHAALESPPILRRVTTNHQETHDYVSRQAYLTLKYNGVYVVHGHEISCVDHDGQAQKLLWQFEYLVDDRRIGVSGRVIEGEKILTPLTFSCSPDLLLPAQGKRINIMQVFKKGVAPKLSAEKLQPPGTPNGRPVSPGFLSLGKAHGWALHRRVQSHGTRQQDEGKTVNDRARIHTSSGTNNSRCSVRTTVENVNEADFGRLHRRASSVGAHSHAARSKILSNLRHGSSTVIKDSIPSTTLPPSRHIIPPSRLAELFDTLEFSQPVSVSICETSTFTPLTPRPRSRHAGRLKSEDFVQR